MRLSLIGFYKGWRRGLKDGLFALQENSENISNNDYIQIEQALEQGEDAANVMFDLIMAILRNEISKKETINFLALKKDDLKSHKHTNDWIIFTPQEQKD